jgi:hypothetical protein
MASRISTAFIFLAALPLFAPTQVKSSPVPAPFYLSRPGGVKAFPNFAIRHEPRGGAGFQKQNGLDAQKLNNQFASINKADPCTGTYNPPLSSSHALTPPHADGEQACVESSFGQCVGGTWQLTPCTGGTKCVALPLVNKAGTSVACDTESDADQRFQDAGVDGGLTGDGQGQSNANGQQQLQKQGDQQIGQRDTGDGQGQGYKNGQQQQGDQQKGQGGTGHGQGQGDANGQQQQGHQQGQGGGKTDQGKIDKNANAKNDGKTAKTSSVRRRRGRRIAETATKGRIRNAMARTARITARKVVKRKFRTRGMATRIRETTNPTSTTNPLRLPSPA